MSCPTRGAMRAAHEPSPESACCLAWRERGGARRASGDRSALVAIAALPPPVNDAGSEATNLRCQSRCNGERLWACNAANAGDSRRAGVLRGSLTRSKAPPSEVADDGDFRAKTPRRQAAKKRHERGILGPIYGLRHDLTFSLRWRVPVVHAMACSQAMTAGEGAAERGRCLDLRSLDPVT
jgi:hypothetical protein